MTTLFNGGEKLFAIDGQHRLAGIKQAVQRENEYKTIDEVSVLLVAHNNSAEGLERTRRLFTILNKSAKPVSKGEIIALDEDDVMAITVRRLLDKNPSFYGDRIHNATTNTLPHSNHKSLTTIGNLYDILTILFTTVKDNTSIKNLRFNRPSDDVLNGYYKYSCNFFEELCRYHSCLNSFFNDKDFSKVVEENRGSFGGHLLFRPIGLKILCNVIAELPKDLSLEERIKKVSQLPMDISEEPYKGIIWDSEKNKIIPSGNTLIKNLLLYMLGKEKFGRKNINNLQSDYAKTLKLSDNEVQLPNKVDSIVW